MPAEKVYGLQHPVFMADGEPEPAPIVPIVDVRWSRDGGFVQVVTKAEDPFGGRATDDEGASYLDGMFVDLDRAAINGLIRNLRRARDQAFGRDE